jgi:hypothetical protein
MQWLGIVGCKGGHAVHPNKPATLEPGDPAHRDDEKWCSSQVRLIFAISNKFFRKLCCITYIANVLQSAASIPLTLCNAAIWCPHTLIFSVPLSWPTHPFFPLPINLLTCRLRCLFSAYVVLEGIQFWFSFMEIHILIVPCGFIFLLCRTAFFCAGDSDLRLARIQFMKRCSQKGYEGWEVRC